MIADIDIVRDFGRLPGPDKLPDAVIEPHLVSAGAELRRWIGDYAATTDADKRAACQEAEACLCLAYLLPVLNTFYTEGIPTIKKETGDIEFRFHDPADLDRVIERWLARARRSVADYGGDTDAGWYEAI